MSENNNKQKRKRVCPHCGRKLWMREFYPLKNGVVGKQLPVDMVP